jgi:hypothetical protein
MASAAKRQGLRPLSQSGLRRIAKNAAQRPLDESGLPAKRTFLDAFNNTATTRVLHATKGWRRISVRRSQAQLITEEVKRGMRPFSSVAMRNV